jgi:adenylate cyclase
MVEAMPSDDPAKLRALLELNALVDDLVEASLRARHTLAETMAAVLPALCARLGLRGAFVRSYSEELELAVYRWPPDLVVPHEVDVFVRTGTEQGDVLVVEDDHDVVIAQPLDVAGEWFGTAGFVVPRGAPAAADVAQLSASLDITCEELDNFLYGIRAAREKHRVMMQLGDALRHRVLSEGVMLAVRVLAEAVALERLLLVCVAEEDQHARTLHVQLYERGELRVDTMGTLPPHPDEATLRDEARAYLTSSDTALLRRFGFEGAREEVLINGVTQAAVVGKLVVAARAAAFNTYDRELLAGFAGFVRQRVVDFNKEWRTLACSFRPDDVARLLRADDYARRYLAPREASVAMLYVDIAGFTRLAEQVLRTPSAVAAFVEAWSREAVDLVWAHGGVFDKMVGDCVIALFGPPFYDQPPGARLAAALACARAVRDMTQKLPQRPGFEALREDGVGVATGVNLAPLFVGRFGPNDNFTGFSSGMNNTARLQGCAARDEILVMSDALAALPAGHGFALGPERSAKVKNVAEPLRFCPLL